MLCYSLNGMTAYLWIPYECHMYTIINDHDNDHEIHHDLDYVHAHDLNHDFKGLGLVLVFVLVLSLLFTLGN